MFALGNVLVEACASATVNVHAEPFDSARVNVPSVPDVPELANVFVDPCVSALSDVSAEPYEITMSHL